MLPPTLELLHRASWAAEKRIKQRGVLAAMLWITQDANGKSTIFETEADAPDDISDAQLLEALTAELREDFRRDHVIRFAVAYEGLLHDVIGTGPLLSPTMRKREVVVIEAFNAEIGARGHRLIYRSGRRVQLGALSHPLERISSSRYAGLLAAENAASATPVAAAAW
jgi:hypothetical protein